MEYVSGSDEAMSAFRAHAETEIRDIEREIASLTAAIRRQPWRLLRNATIRAQIAALRAWARGVAEGSLL